MLHLRKLLKQKNLIVFALFITFLSGYIPAYAVEAPNLEKGQTYYGFKLLDVKNITEINSTAEVFEHVKTGAKLIYLNNEDVNKVFSINFFTPPTDDTGVNHILEHSVLEGSQKYPVKSPIQQMEKQSMNTFLNALTSADKTCFPISSKNDKDFRNLMDVYLNAVFYPNAVKMPEIFMQEGWRYELDSKDENLNYNGVVYNEMKGEYSSPNTLLYDNMLKSLFPDTLYNWNSGGDPEIIPQLTREKFIEVYNKNYTPSNSYIYLYGKLDILDNLKYIDGEYLSKFDKVNVDNTIPMQKPFKARQTRTAEYPVSNGTDTKNKTYLALNYVLDNISDKENYIAMCILNDLLMDSNAAPLKKALGEASIGDIAYGSMDSNLQPIFSIVVENSNENQKNKFETVVTDTLNKVVKSGIDSKLIDAAFSSYETSKQKSITAANKGIKLNDSIMMGWLYAGDPTKYLETDSIVSKIKNSSKEKYFEKLIEKNLLNNKHSSLVVLKPKTGMEEENVAKTQKLLNDYKGKLSESAVDTLVNQTKAFKAWQNTKDSDEAIRSLPSLTASDVNTKAEVIPSEEDSINDVKILKHKIDTNKMEYLNMYFDASTIPQDKISYLFLLSSLLGYVDTDKYLSKNIPNEIALNSGDIKFNVIAPPKYKDDKVYYPKFVVATSTTADKMAKTLDLIREITNKSKLDNKSKLKYLIKVYRESMESSINDNGLSLAKNRANSYYSQTSAFEEQAGLSFYEFVCDLDNNFDSKADTVIKNLKEVSSKIFNKNNLIIGFTGDDDGYKAFGDSADYFLNQFASAKLDKNTYNFNCTAKNEGLIGSGKVQYVVKGANYKDLGYSFNGNMYVLQSILSKDYLYNNVRVNGGAYGTGVSISDTGNVYFYSYRDPNLKETLNVFDKAGDYLRNTKMTDAEMTNYIIGTLASLDSPISPRTQGTVSDIYYIIGETQEDIQRERDEILNTKWEDISKYADMLDAIVKQNNFCVFGSKTAIEQNKDIFKKTLDVINHSKK